MTTVEMARHEKAMFLRGIDDCDMRIKEIMDEIGCITKEQNPNASRLRLNCAKLARWMKRRKRYMMKRDRAEKVEKNGG